MIPDRLGDCADADDGPLADLPQHAEQREAARYEGLLREERTRFARELDERGGTDAAESIRRMEEYCREIDIHRPPPRR